MSLKQLSNKTLKNFTFIFFKFFIDLAYKYLTSKSEYRPYLLSESNIDLEQPVDVQDNRNRFMVTLGFKL